MKMFWSIIAIAASIAINGCGGGGGGGSDGSGVKPPADPPVVPPTVTLTVKGMVLFNANTINPMVALAAINDDGNYVIVGKAVKITALAGSGEVTKPFVLNLPDSSNGDQLFFISFSDANADSKFQQPELMGECAYRIVYLGAKKWQVEDAFRAVQSWGVDATLCSSDQLTIDLILSS